MIDWELCRIVWDYREVAVVTGNRPESLGVNGNIRRWLTTVSHFNLNRKCLGMRYYKTFDKPYDLTTGADVATALHGMLDRHASDAPVRLRVSERSTSLVVFSVPLSLFTKCSSYLREIVLTPLSFARSPSLFRSAIATIIPN